MEIKRGDSIYWVEIDKVKPNPYQPRRVFDEHRLFDLSNSIKQYGILQPLVVVKKEVLDEDGNMMAIYELIAGERRLRASKLAGLKQVPVIIRTKEDSDRVKLELAIIENLQREDLNPIDRARAFKDLSEKFSLKHSDIAIKVGKSREYISNSIRLLLLPKEVSLAIESGVLSEGHARPILMLQDRLEEQKKLFDEIILRKLTVRDAEVIARNIATDRIRKKDKIFSPEVEEVKKIISEKLGTRVHIQSKTTGGQILIDFFSEEDLPIILEKLLSAGNLDEISQDSIKLLTSSTESIEDPSLADSDDTNSEDDMYSFRNFSL